MHTFPLHRPFPTECLCCRVEQEFTFTSQSDQVVCKGCIRHQGDATVKANQRDTDHVGLWRSELALTKEDHDEVVAQLRVEIERRDQQIADRRTEIADLQAVVRAGVESAPLPRHDRSEGPVPPRQRPPAPGRPARRARPACRRPECPSHQS